jgi:hypothetical protein
MSSLNGLAKTYDAFDGQLRLSMMPYNTMKTKHYLTHMRELYGDELENSPATYAMVMGAWVDCEMLADENDLTPDAQGLLYFWQHRTGDKTKDYEAFHSVLSIASFDVLWEAYASTRAKISKASVELHGGMPLAEDDPLPISVGRKSGKKKSSR